MALEDKSMHCIKNMVRDRQVTISVDINGSLLRCRGITIPRHYLPTAELRTSKEVRSEKPAFTFASGEATYLGASTCLTREPRIFQYRRSQRPRGWLEEQ
jgi:hypothetical protein